MSISACPACSGSLRFFHAQDGVPAHSCLLLASRQDAVSYPKGDIALGVCEACGFITNMEFNPALSDYSTSYEETQGFSPRFRAFAHDLAARWIDRYDIRDKDVLEIGCGKGEFLALMCELGGNRGVGIDPSYVPGRHNAETDRARFISELYNERHAGLAADVVVCRHTLEHIQPVGGFLHMVRRAIGDRRDVVVLFEVPDTLRVLQEGAFWDVYYEHCSYFTAGSLARLFRASGFDILDLSLEFDGQYLVVEAVPADGPVTAEGAGEDDLAEIEAGVQRFRNAYSATVRLWREELLVRRANKERSVIWGAGSKGVSFVVTMGPNSGVDYAVDINPLKQGMYLAGVGTEVVAPEFLKARPPDLVVVMNPIYIGEITEMLDALDVHPDVRAV
ncbi:MAG: class I SAM-dependent methyltransferase [Acidimicrobiales bacterium]|nr:class I SAM-dependent methyltransferase [Acidimicrobiales bacterium]